MKKILNLFSVPMLEATVADVDILNCHLLNSIAELFDKNDSKRILSHMWKNNLQQNEKSNLGYSSFNQHDILQHEKFQDLFSTLSPIIDSFFLQLYFNGTWRWENAWCNVYPSHAYVPLHDHRGVHWSGVYYVQADPSCGQLLLTDPKEYALSNEPASTFNRGNMISSIIPLAGKFVLFPGYLKHESEPNESINDRVIISFNINCSE